MRRLPVLYRSALASTALRAASVVLGLLVFLVAARAVSPAEFGRFGLMIAVQFALAAIITCGYQRGVLRYVPQFRAQNKPEQIDLIFRDALVATGLGAGAVLTIATGSLHVLSSLGFDFLFDLRDSLLICFVCIVFALNQLFCHLLRGLGSLQGALCYQEIVWRALFVGVVALLWWAGLVDGFATLALVYGAALTAASAMALAAIYRRGVRPTFANAPRAYATVTIRRFWLLETVVAASTQVDVFLLNAFVPIEQVGFYVAAKRMAGLLAFFLNIANFVIAPRLSELHARGEHAELQRQLAYGALLATVPAACGFAVFLVVPSALMGLFGPAFAAHGLLLILCSGAQLINAAAGPVAILLNQTGHERITLRTRTATLIASVLLGVPLCFLLQTVGAALTQVSSLLFWNGTMYLWVRRHTPYDPTLLGLAALWQARKESTMETSSLQV